MLYSPAYERSSSGVVPGTSDFIRLEGITKRYGDFCALDDVSLSVEAGEFISILGPSGSGKSTLLMVVAGFIRPNQGRLFIEHRDIVRMPANKRGFGVVFQNYALFPHMDVMANVTFPLRVRGVSGGDAVARAEKAIDVGKLTGLGSRRISELSGGQRQRVALARAIVFEPKVLLMDEPLSALDKALREEMQIEIRELHNKLQITTLYVTHDQREALTIGDRVAVMDKGRIVQIDTPEEVYRRPTSEFVARFIGEAIILPIEEARRVVEGNLVVPGDAARSMMVRSEDVCLLPNAGAGPDWLKIVGTLRGIVFQGDSWLLQVDLTDSQPIQARAQRQFSGEIANLQPGEPIHLYVDPRHVHFL